MQVDGPWSFWPDRSSASMSSQLFAGSRAKASALEKLEKGEIRGGTRGNAGGGGMWMPTWQIEKSPDRNMYGARSRTISVLKLEGKKPVLSDRWLVLWASLRAVNLEPS